MRRAKAATWETDAMADWNAAFGRKRISAPTDDCEMA